MTEPIHVLLVSDHDTRLKELTAFLGTHPDFIVHPANIGKEAERLLLQEPLSVGVLGFELVPPFYAGVEIPPMTTRKRRSRASRPANCAIPEYPVLFNKFNNTLNGHGHDVTLPKVTEKVDYEAELAIVIGKKAKYVSREDALSYVFGYCNINDLSARDLQMRTSQWLLGKTCDGFSPLGPYLVTADEAGNPNELSIKCIVNGEVRQSSNTSEGEQVVIRKDEEHLHIQLLQSVAFGHKIAITDIPADTDVRKYGEVIGRATTDIQTGEHVHVHNIEGIRGRGDQAKKGESA